MATQRVKIDTNVWLDTPEFDDAFDHRPQWASESYISEYLAHLISIGWTPKTHEWSDAAKERRVA
jgi:hypothetical protein